MKQSNRAKKGLQIFSEANNIRKISKNHYAVESQSSDRTYNVTKLQDADVYTCECKDFIYRLNHKDDKRCKHVMSVIILQDTIDSQNKIEKIEKPKVCPKCYSTTITKNGYRKVKGDIKRQRYSCKQCNYKFILGEDGFSKVSSDPKIITESINMYMSGMSYRKIRNHIEMNHGMKLSHTAIYNWLGKYMRIIREYVDTISPEFVSPDVWGVDEMVLNIKDTKPIPKKGFYDWMWSIIDPQTRFIIATEVSKKRELSDARKIMNTGVRKSNSKPSYIITDSLRSYEKAVKKELDARKTAHIKTKSLSDGFANRPIERYHNEIREKTRTMRGCGNDESAQNFADNYRTYHNFVRKHSALGKTPAEATGIDLDLSENKIKDLIQNSTEEGNFVTQLGKRINKVSITNEGDCIKVSPRGWIDKAVWREINDILKLSEFSWLSNGKDSCWMKLILIFYFLGYNDLITNNLKIKCIV